MTVAAADLLADVERRGLLLAALADDDRAADGDRVERPPHRLDGGLIGARLVAATHEARRRERRRLRDPCHLERQVPIHQAPPRSSAMRKHTG